MGEPEAMNGLRDGQTGEKVRVYLIRIDIGRFLYSALAGVYHEMYQHVFDYDEEYAFYDDLLTECGCWKILEIGWR